MINLQPRYIHVTHGDHNATLAHYRLGQGERRVLITAGVHGREHGGIQTAYELVERLAEVGKQHVSGSRLRGQVDVLPVCNPMAYAAGTRFTPGSDRDMARAFSASEPVDITEAIAQTIMSLAEEAEVVLNLHSAGEARYLPHVLFYREEDAEWAASLGFPFAIKRGTPESLAHHILSYLRPGQRTLTLELGGGTVVFPEDVTLSLDLITAFLGRSGLLAPGDYERRPTPPEMVWLTDARVLVPSPAEGAFYTHAQPGADFAVGEPFGFLVSLEDVHPRPVLAPTTGKLIYLRTRNRVPHGGTLAMFLPRQDKCHEEER